MGLASSTPRRRLYRRARPIIIAVLIVWGVYSFLMRKSVDHQDSSSTDSKAVQNSPVREQLMPQPSVPLPPLEIRKDLVVASMTTDNTSWLFEFFPDWHKSVYVVDDKDAQLTVSKNKGRESMVYLTYVLFSRTTIQSM
jgi:hypothetical protein